MGKVSVKKIKLKTLLSHFVKDQREDKKFCFVLGSGASKQSGIPTGGELVKRWIEELNTLYDEPEIRAWMKTADININNPAPHYSVIYAKRFELDPKEGYYELERIMEGKEPSCGYSILAQVLASGKHNIVISVNFDSLMEDAMFIYTSKRPLVCSHESLATFIKPIQTRPLIAKIHRDILLAPKSDPDETSELEKSWEKALSNIFKLYTPIVIGYGGNDSSLMGFLNNLDAIEGRFFWCYKQTDGLPDERIKSLVAKHNGYLVPIEGFDEMMVQLNSYLGYELLDKEILSIAKKRADNYREQFEKIQKSKLSAETSKALEKTIKSSKLDWWNVILSASKEKDSDKIEQIYSDGLEMYPDSCQLIGTYASFLRRIRKDYDRAEKYYKKVLELAPDYANNVGNYASFLYEVRRDYDNAEKYYKKALEIEPNQAVTTNNYAIFLRLIRKDYDNAEKYYKKALEIEPNNADNINRYASFLRYARGDYDNAEKYYKRALELEPNNANNINAYAGFLHEARRDYDNAEKYYKKALGLEPNQANYAGNYAKFLIVSGDIHKAEEYIDKAFSLKVDNESLLVELWFYRYAIFPDKYRDAYENIVKLIKSGARSIGWQLENVIEMAQKRGHKEIETLKKLDKIITEDTPIDILNNP